MGFNYAKEKAEFEREWAELRKQYEGLGMSQEAIEELYAFDWDWFKSRRRYSDHLVDLPEEAAVEVIQQASTGTVPGDIPVSLGAAPSQWLDEIEDEDLLRKLILLSDDDIALLTYLTFEELTQSEIAQRESVNQATISRRFSQIQKFLKNVHKTPALDA